jgi:hypothetical protein
MPKKARDYSKSCIYQICCRDPDIRDIYVGSTIDLVKRRAQHKALCNNPNSGDHNFHVYQYIRDNGGWENWQVVQIEKVVCESSQDLCQREREVFERLKPSLNTYRPKVSPEETKDDQRARDKAWREANPERSRARTRAWREANPERYKATTKAWIESNPGRQKATTKAWIESNPERQKANMKAWQTKKVICEHCGTELNQSSLKRHQGRKKCLTAQAVNEEYQRLNQEYVNERKGVTPDID